MAVNSECSDTNNIKIKIKIKIEYEITKITEVTEFTNTGDGIVSCIATGTKPSAGTVSSPVLWTGPS